jgi:hypothetical protein
MYPNHLAFSSERLFEINIQTGSWVVGWEKARLTKHSEEEVKGEERG